jgi:hypothetical protein
MGWGTGSVWLHPVAGECPSVADGAVAPAEGGDGIGSSKRKTTRVGRSWAECTGPKGRWGWFRWETKRKKWRQAARGNGLKSKNKEKWAV